MRTATTLRACLVGPLPATATTTRSRFLLNARALGRPLSCPAPTPSWTDATDATVRDPANACMSCLCTCLRMHAEVHTPPISSSSSITNSSMAIVNLASRNLRASPLSFTQLWSDFVFQALLSQNSVLLSLVPARLGAGSWPCSRARAARSVPLAASLTWLLSQSLSHSRVLLPTPIFHILSILLFHLQVESWLAVSSFSSLQKNDVVRRYESSRQQLAGICHIQTVMNFFLSHSPSLSLPPSSSDSSYSSSSSSSHSHCYSFFIFLFLFFFSSS